MLEARYLKQESIALESGGKSGLLYRFPELADRGFEYILSGSDWDMSLAADQPATTAEGKAPFKAVKEQFSLRQDSEPKDLVIMRQCHSSRLIIPLREAAYSRARVVDFMPEAESVNQFPTELEAEQLGFGYRYHSVDGILTSEPELITASTHADCAPVIIFDQRQKLLLNLHSGWRGTLALFPLHALNYLTKYHAVELADLIMVLGPMIGAEDYEVEADVAEPFMQSFGQNSGVIKRRSELKYELNLGLAISLQAEKFGLQNGQLFRVGGSTFAEPAYHSYRRDGRERFGLMMSFTAIN
ncbi:MAG: polyphenol oxidase family protein [Eubacteriales bacterium]|nr:polyphenol oxidase family protein [Eubacteriales bacterium]